MRVLTIAHNAVAASNRQRIAALRAIPDVEVQLLTPRWWFEEGRRITLDNGVDWRVGRTVFTGNGTRHMYLSGLLGAVRGFRPDVIDLFEEPFSLVALQTLLARNVLAPGAALVLYSAVNVSRQWRWPYAAVERIVLRGADAVHAPNGDVPPILRARGLRGAAEVIPLGVDVDRFASAEAMELAQIPRPRVGFLGRFEAVKGLDVLIEAFAQVRSPASLVVVGDGPLSARIKGSNVHRLEAVSYERVPQLLKALDVLVLPSVTILPLHREQFGRVLVEAMAAGVPVIGSSSGAIPEVVGDAGVVVPERDAGALAEAIENVLNKRELREQLIARGRMRAKRSFDWPVVANQTVKLFRSAMLHRRRAQPTLEEARA